jgi:hypothetical protein
MVTVSLEDEAASVAAQELRRRARRWRTKALQLQKTSEIEAALRVGDLLDQAATAIEQAAQPTLERTPPTLERIGARVLASEALHHIIRDDPLSEAHVLPPVDADEEATRADDNVAIVPTLPDLNRKR